MRGEYGLILVDNSSMMVEQWFLDGLMMAIDGLTVMLNDH